MPREVLQGCGPWGGGSEAEGPPTPQRAGPQLSRCEGDTKARPGWRPGSRAARRGGRRAGGTAEPRPRPPLCPEPLGGEDGGGLLSARPDAAVWWDKGVTPREHAESAPRRPWQRHCPGPERTVRSESAKFMTFQRETTPGGGGRGPARAGDRSPQTPGRQQRAPSPGRASRGRTRIPGAASCPGRCGRAAAGPSAEPGAPARAPQRHRRSRAVGRVASPAKAPPPTSASVRFRAGRAPRAPRSPPRAPRAPRPALPAPQPRAPCPALPAPQPRLLPAPGSPPRSPARSLLPPSRQVRVLPATPRGAPSHARARRRRD